MIHQLFTTVLLVSLIIPAQVFAEQAAAPEGSKVAAIAAKPPQDLAAEITRLQQQLEAQRSQLNTALAQAQASQADNAVELLEQQRLAEQFIFIPQTRFQAQFTQTQSALEPKSASTAKLLTELASQYQKLLQQYPLIEQSVAAHKRAQTTHTDSKMYYEMRVRSALPPKTLKAYGLMEMAKQQSDQGQFAAALKLWEQAEIMVRESFNEHIAAMAKWREDTLKQAEIEKQKAKVKAEAILTASMVTIAGGEFLMGSASDSADEMPVHKVAVKSFQLSNTETTYELYDLCIASSSCFYVPPDGGWGKANRPVINVSYRDITEQFLPWLNNLTGRAYRLPSEAEWEYAARAGSSSEYFWGDSARCELARFDGGPASVCSKQQGINRGTAPVKQFKANAWGLFDMHGNTWEWVEDCWHPSYEGAPSDGSAWLEGNCAIRVLRGGAWDYPATGMRAANRYYFAYKTRRDNYGFRLALSIKP